MTTAPSGGSTRFRELDGLRGIAALAVVIYHLTVAFDTTFPGQPAPSFRLPYGLYGVQLFFLISGFVILMSGRRAARASDFVISRVSRLYPVYWLALGLSLAISFGWSAWPLRVDGWTALANVTMIQRWLLIENVDAVYWTLAIEMQFYVLVFVLLWLTRCRLDRRVLLAVAVLWLAVSVVVAFIAGPHSRGLDPQAVATPYKLLLNASLAEFGPLFVAGYLTYLARNGEIRRGWSVAAMVIAVVNARVLHSTTDSLGVLFVAVAFFIVTSRERTGVLLVRPFQWLGRVSYSLYVFHTLLGEYITYTLTPLVGRDLAMVVALAAVCVTATVLHEVGEVRGTRALKRALVGLRERISGPAGQTAQPTGT